MWGQGLLDEMKFRNIVAGWIQSHLGGRPVRQFAYAHSGSQILVDSGETDYAPNLSGEIPRSYPSITLQAKTATTEVATAGRTFNTAAFTPGDVDLVVLDGGINDVGIFNVLLPTNSTAAVKNMAADKCIGRMDSLLTLVQNSFPNAAIVLAGYFQIASQVSDPAQLTAYLEVLMGPAFATVASGFGYVLGLGLSQPAIGQMINNSLTWKNETDAGLIRLVHNANLRYVPYRPQVAFASPLFEIDNSYAAPHSYLYNLSDFLSVEAAGQAGFGEPRDPLADVQWTRARACVAAGRVKTPNCPEASTGHPNQYGARAYADAVLTQIWTTLAPHLATRGLVENPICASLRSQENTAIGTVRGVQELLGEMGKEQQDCQAGRGPGDGGRSYKPKQCGALENEAEKKKLNASMEAAEARLGPIRGRSFRPDAGFRVSRAHSPSLYAKGRVINKRNSRVILRGCHENVNPTRSLARWSIHTFDQCVWFAPQGPTKPERRQTAAQQAAEDRLAQQEQEEAQACTAAYANVAPQNFTAAVFCLLRARRRYGKSSK